MKNTVEKQAPKQAEEPKPNLTGIPAQMKQDFERRSGLSFDDVRVHYNSDKPAQLQALAYTQGTQIYVAPGQERHLPHELGHEAQQKEGIVKPTRHIGGVPVNDDARLERSADALPRSAFSSQAGTPVVQRILITDIPASTLAAISAVRDTGIWWTMACEWRFQQNLSTLLGNVAPVDPLTFIHSAGDFVGGAVAGAINVAAGDRARMVMHGYNPNGIPIPSVHFSGRPGGVAAGPVPVDPLVQNIDASITDPQGVLPFYCFMGQNPIGHTGRIPPLALGTAAITAPRGIGPGPMIMPPGVSASLDMGGYGAAIQNATATQSATWNTVIDANGMFIPIDLIPGLNTAWSDFQIPTNQTTANFATLLNLVYNTVERCYTNFYQFLHAQGATTGEGGTIW